MIEESINDNDSLNQNVDNITGQGEKKIINYNYGKRYQSSSYNRNV